MHILIKSVPKKEGIVARDLCDCLYYYRADVRCEVLSSGRVYVYSDIDTFRNCYNLKYFKKLIKSFEVFDDVYLHEPVCERCHVVKIGNRYFVRWGV